MQTANLDPRRRGDRPFPAGLVEVPLAFDFFFPDAVRFIPMSLSPTISNSNERPCRSRLLYLDRSLLSAMHDFQSIASAVSGDTMIIGKTSP